MAVNKAFILDEDIINKIKNSEFGDYLENHYNNGFVFNFKRDYLSHVNVLIKSGVIELKITGRRGVLKTLTIVGNYHEFINTLIVLNDIELLKKLIYMIKICNRKSILCNDIRYNLSTNIMEYQYNKPISRHLNLLA